MLIKQIPIHEGKLFAISNGNRRYIANFTGDIKIYENTKLISILGKIKEGTKSIRALLVVTDDVEYIDNKVFDLVDNISLFEGRGECLGERINFYVMEFIDNDPIRNELRFEIKDLRLIERLLKGSNY
ncbi:MAG: hypothetical protein KHZ87_08380 [Clostridiales bacterium]|nr:hypothetical protein [Clostridiales bacterium]